MSERIDKRVSEIFKQEEAVAVESIDIAPVGVTPPGLLEDIGIEPAKPREPVFWNFYIALGMDLPPTINEPEEAEAYLMEALELGPILEELAGYIRHGMHKPPEMPYAKD